MKKTVSLVVVGAMLLGHSVWAETLLTTKLTKNTAFTSVEAMPDGGYVTVGYQEVQTNQYDAIVYKYSKTNKLVWSKTYATGDDDSFASVAVSATGAVIAAGYSGSNATIVSFDAQGKKGWKYVLKGVGRDYYYNGVTVLKNGNIVAVGADLTDTEQYGLVSVLNQNGKFLNMKTYGNGDGTEFNNVSFTKDGGFVAVGWGSVKPIDSFSTEAGLLARFTAKGALKTYTQNVSPDETQYLELTDVAETADGYITAGYATQIDENTGEVVDESMDAFVSRVLTDESVVWTQKYAGTNYDMVYGIALATDGTLRVAGTTSSKDGYAISRKYMADDAFVSTIGRSGKLINTKFFGGNKADTLFAVTTLGTGYIAVGGTHSKDGDLKGRKTTSLTNDGFIVRN